MVLTEISYEITNAIEINTKNVKLVKQISVIK